MAMQPLGDTAGLGAAIIGSLSSMVSVPVAVFVGSFIDEVMTPIAIGFVGFGVITFLFFWFAERPKAIP
jgi:DHA1 family bicyclomycin/chloramphenicol resistance-like MFS transporter